MTCHRARHRPRVVGRCALLTVAVGIRAARRHANRPSRSRSTPEEVGREPCPDSRFECVTITVPRDHFSNGGETWEVTYAIQPAAVETPRDVRHDHRRPGVGRHLLRRRLHRRDVTVRSPTTTTSCSSTSAGRALRAGALRRGRHRRSTGHRSTTTADDAVDEIDATARARSSTTASTRATSTSTTCPTTHPPGGRGSRGRPPAPRRRPDRRCTARATARSSCRRTRPRTPTRVAALIVDGVVDLTVDVRPWYDESRPRLRRRARAHLAGLRRRRGVRRRCGHRRSRGRLRRARRAARRGPDRVRAAAARRHHRDRASSPPPT